MADGGEGGDIDGDFTPYHPQHFHLGLDGKAEVKLGTSDMARAL